MKTNELQDMREQMSLLKQMLQKEQIVNDSLLRNSMCSKLSTIHRKAWRAAFWTLYVMTFGVWAFRMVGFSWWLIGATVVVMLVSLLGQIRVHKRFGSDMVLTGDISTVARAAQRLKQDYINRLGAEMIAFGVLQLWFAMELIFGGTIYSDSSLAIRIAVIAVLIVSSVTWGIMSYRSHRKVLRLCDDMVEALGEA